MPPVRQVDARGHPGAGARVRVQAQDTEPGGADPGAGAGSRVRDGDAEQRAGARALRDRVRDQPQGKLPQRRLQSRRPAVRHGQCGRQHQGAGRGQDARQIQPGQPGTPRPVRTSGH